MNSEQNNSPQSEKLRRYRSPALRGRSALSLTAPLCGTQELIHDRLWDTLLEGELRPGTKMPELHIGKAFKVHRTAVRNVLIIMEQEGVVALSPNRGASIAIPSPEKTKFAFETARLISVYNVESLAADSKSIGTEDRERIRQHLQFLGEQKTVPRNYRTVMRLGTEFLILLASIHQNELLASMQERMVSLLMIAALLYQRPAMEWPRVSALADIVEHIYAGNNAKAAIEVRYCLTELEDSFRYYFEEPNTDIASWECHEFRVRRGIMGNKETQYVTTQRPFDTECPSRPTACRH